MITQANTLPNSLRELTSSELDMVGGGAGGGLNGLLANFGPTVTSVGTEINDVGKVVQDLGNNLGTGTGVLPLPL